MSSMLNKNGKGTLYFGVRNDGEILGQQIGDRTLREISQEIANEISRQVGLGMTTITKRIHRLKEKGIIEREGSKKTGQWKVNMKLR